jgi:uncharacterized protein (TIGR02246 family)
LKNFILCLFVILFIGCTSQEPKPLTENERATIIDEIMELTTDWANAHNRMDPEKAIEFYDSTGDLMYAENGVFFANRDSIYSFLKGFYASTKSMDVQWQQRVVIPLSQNAATMSGSFHFKALFKDESSFEGNPMFTGVFVKRNDKWVLIHGHESFK